VKYDELIEFLNDDDDDGDDDDDDDKNNNNNKEISNEKLRTFKMGNNITCTINCTWRITAKLYARNMVYFRHVIANILRKGDK
jgi:hypothetical protein